MTKEENDIKIKYLYTEHFDKDEVDSAGLYIPKAGDLFKAFYSENGESPYILPESIVVDVNDESPMTEGMMIMDIDGEDSYSFKEVTTDNIENFDLTEEQLNKLADWMSKEDSYIKEFVMPFKTMEEKLLKGMDFDENEVWAEDKKDTASKLEELKKLDPNITKGLSEYIDDLHHSHTLNQSEDTTSFMMQNYQKILNNKDLGKGANIASIFSSLMGYMQTNQTRLLKNLIYHAITELNRKNKENG